MKFDELDALLDAPAFSAAWTSGVAAARWAVLTEGEHLAKHGLIASELAEWHPSLGVAEKAWREGNAGLCALQVALRCRATKCAGRFDVGTAPRRVFAGDHIVPVSSQVTFQHAENAVTISSAAGDFVLQSPMRVLDASQVNVAALPAYAIGSHACVFASLRRPASDIEQVGIIADTGFETRGRRRVHVSKLSFGLDLLEHAVPDLAEMAARSSPMLVMNETDAVRSGGHPALPGMVTLFAGSEPWQFADLVVRESARQCLQALLCVYALCDATEMRYCRLTRSYRSVLSVLLAASMNLVSLQLFSRTSRYSGSWEIPPSQSRLTQLQLACEHMEFLSHAETLTPHGSALFSCISLAPEVSRTVEMSLDVG